MDGKVQSQYDIVAKMDAGDYWFGESLTARLWSYLVDPSFKYGDIKGSGVFVWPSCERNNDVYKTPDPFSAFRAPPSKAATTSPRTPRSPSGPSTPPGSGTLLPGAGAPHRKPTPSTPTREAAPGRRAASAAPAAPADTLGSR